MANKDLIKSGDTKENLVNTKKSNIEQLENSTKSAINSKQSITENLEAEDEYRTLSDYSHKYKYEGQRTSSEETVSADVEVKKTDAKASVKDKATYSQRITDKNLREYRQNKVKEENQKSYSEAYENGEYSATDYTSEDYAPTYTEKAYTQDVAARDNKSFTVNNSNSELVQNNSRELIRSSNEGFTSKKESPQQTAQKKPANKYKNRNKVRTAPQEYNSAQLGENYTAEHTTTNSAQVGENYQQQANTVIDSGYSQKDNIKTDAVREQTERASNAKPFEVNDVYKSELSRERKSTVPEITESKAKKNVKKQRKNKLLQSQREKNEKASTTENKGFTYTENSHASVKSKDSLQVNVNDKRLDTNIQGIDVQSNFSNGNRELASGQTTRQDKTVSKFQENVRKAQKQEQIKKVQAEIEKSSNIGTYTGQNVEYKDELEDTKVSFEQSKTIKDYLNSEETATKQKTLLDKVRRKKLNEHIKDGKKEKVNKFSSYINYIDENRADTYFTSTENNGYKNIDVNSLKFDNGISDSLEYRKDSFDFEAVKNSTASKGTKADSSTFYERLKRKEKLQKANSAQNGENLKMQQKEKSASELRAERNARRAENSANRSSIRSLINTGSKVNNIVTMPVRKLVSSGKESIKESIRTDDLQEAKLVYGVANTPFFIRDIFRQGFFKKLSAEVFEGAKAELSELAQDSNEAKYLDYSIKTYDIAKQGVRAVSKTVQGTKKSTDKLKAIIKKLRRKKQKAAIAKSTMKLKKAAVKASREAIRAVAQTILKVVLATVPSILIYIVCAFVIIIPILYFIWDFTNTMDTTRIIQVLSDCDAEMQLDWFNNSYTTLELDRKTNSSSSNSYEACFALALDSPPTLNIDTEDNFNTVQSNGSPYIKRGTSSDGKELKPIYHNFDKIFSSSDEMLEEYRWTTDDYISALTYLQIAAGNLRWYDRLSLFGHGDRVLDNMAKDLHKATHQDFVMIKNEDAEDGETTYSVKNMTNIYKDSFVSASGRHINYFYGRKYSVDYLVKNGMLPFDSDPDKQAEAVKRYENMKKYGNTEITVLSSPLSLQPDEKIKDRIVKHFGKQVIMKYEPPTSDNPDKEDYGTITKKYSYHNAIDLKADEGDYILAPISGICVVTQRDMRGFEYVISTAYDESGQIKYDGYGYLVKMSMSDSSFIPINTPTLVTQGQVLGKVMSGNNDANYQTPSKDNDTENEDIYASKLFPCFTGTDFKSIGSEEYDLPDVEYDHLHLELYNLPCDFSSFDSVDENVLDPELFFDYSDEN